MHELSVCAALRDEVLRIAAARRARAVKSVHLRIGPLSGIDPDALAQAYPFACAGTACADAALVIDAVPVQVRCSACGASSGVQPQRLACASCGNPQTTIISGDEMLLSSVELVLEECDV